MTKQTKSHVVYVFSKSDQMLCCFIKKLSIESTVKTDQSVWMPRLTCVLQWRQGDTAWIDV